MKKIILSLVLISFILISVFVLNTTVGRFSSYEKALNQFHQSSRTPITIYKSVPIHKGAFIFYKANHDVDYMSHAFVHKNLMGWKCSYGGVSKIDDLPERIGLTASFYPKTQGTKAATLFGFITDDLITHVTVEEITRGEPVIAEIINLGHIGVWVMYLDRDDLEGQTYAILATASNKKTYSLQETLPSSFK